MTLYPIFTLGDHAETMRQNDPTTRPESADMIAALERCQAALRQAQEEVARALELVAVALGTARQQSVQTEATERLARLVEAQGRQIVEQVKSLSSSPDIPVAQGPFLFAIDRDDRTVRIGRRRVPLTRTEFRLVEHLWLCRPRPVSRQALLDHLYGDQEQPGDAVIDMFIFKIRQKLRNAGCVDATIDVVRGEGWLLNIEPPAESPAPPAEIASLAP